MSDIEKLEAHVEALTTALQEVIKERDELLRALGSLLADVALGVDVTDEAAALLRGGK